MSNGWQTFKDPDGTLVPINFYELVFMPKRIFYVCDIPKGEERGNHAHYETQQIITCVRGKILVKLHDGEEQWQKTLMPHESIYIGKMIWDSQVFLTGDDILLSMCSTYYDKADYIEDFDMFLEQAAKKFFENS